jgi:hypothetical protein
LKNGNKSGANKNEPTSSSYLIKKNEKELVLKSTATKPEAQKACVAGSPMGMNKQ